MKIDIVLSIVALVVSILTLIVTWYVFKKDHDRRKKQATIEYFDIMTRDLFNIQSKFVDNLNSNDFNINKIENDPELLKDATNVLSSFERLSVGINTNIFDFEIINRMAGSYLIYMYSVFAPYINNIRRDASRTKSYEEFEYLVNRLKENRNPLSNDGIIH